MDRKDEIKAEVERLAHEALDLLELGDTKAAHANVAKTQVLLREYITLIPDGRHKDSLLESIAEGDKLLVNGEDA